VGAWRLKRLANVRVNSAQWIRRMCWRLQLWRDRITGGSKSIRMWNYRIYIDNAAMQLLRWPKQFDTIVTGNLFATFSDAAMLTGSIGMLPSASLGASGQVGVLNQSTALPQILRQIKPTSSASVECGDDATLRLESANCRRPN